MARGSVLDCSKRGQHKLTWAQPTESNCLRSVIMCVVADDPGGEQWSSGGGGGGGCRRRERGVVPGSVELIKENGHGDGRLQTVLVGIDSGVVLVVVEVVMVVVVVVVMVVVEGRHWYNSVERDE